MSPPDFLTLVFCASTPRNVSLLFLVLSFFSSRFTRPPRRTPPKPHGVPLPGSDAALPPFFRRLIPPLRFLTPLPFWTRPLSRYTSTPPGAPALPGSPLCVSLRPVEKPTTWAAPFYFPWSPIIHRPSRSLVISVFCPRPPPPFSFFCRNPLRSLR